MNLMIRLFVRIFAVVTYMLFSSSCQHFVWGTETGEHEDRPPVRIRSAKPKPKVFKEFLSQAGMDLCVLEALLEDNAVLSRHCEGLFSVMKSASSKMQDWSAQLQMFLKKHENRGKATSKAKDDRLNQILVKILEHDTIIHMIKDINAMTSQVKTAAETAVSVRIRAFA